MLLSSDALKLFGIPQQNAPYLTNFYVPERIWFEPFPKTIYLNKAMLKPLEKALSLIKENNLMHYIKSYDGCFNIRKQRTGNLWSLHSWGLAIDLNAKENQLFAKPMMNLDVVKCFSDAGFDWGGYWKRPDGMHFQLKKELLNA